jgi:hypothetical protein
MRVGDEIPPFARETGLANWNRFAAVNDEFASIHMDDEAAKSAGQPGAIGMGNLQWSYLHVLLRRWLQGRGRVVRIICEFRAPNRKGQLVVAHGRISGVSKQAGTTVVDLELWTTGDGNVLSRGQATVAFG